MPAYMLPAILAKTIANKNSKISLLKRGCRLALSAEVIILIFFASVTN